MSDARGDAEDPPDRVCVYRRVHPRHLVSGPNGSTIVSSAAFTNTSGTDEMSVLLADTWEACDSRTPHDLLDDERTARVVALSAGVVRRPPISQRVVRSPEVPADPCDAHGGVLGTKPKPIQRSLRDASNQVAP
jgi:hypothetical protein